MTRDPVGNSYAHVGSGERPILALIGHIDEIGVAITNFNEGGRLAIVQGNLVRNLRARRPAGTDPNDGAGIGIAVEADTSVTGNVIENAPVAGIAVALPLPATSSAPSSRSGCC